MARRRHHTRWRRRRGGRGGETGPLAPPCGFEGRLMDPISAWIASWKIPLGRWGRSFFEFLTAHFAWLFDTLANWLGAMLDSAVGLLLAVPPALLILVVAALAHALQRSWKLSLGVILGLAFIVNQGL